jgi:hypothetical protein
MEKFFAEGEDKDWSFNTSLLLAEDAGVRTRVHNEVVRRSLGLLTIVERAVGGSRGDKKICNR